MWQETVTSIPVFRIVNEFDDDFGCSFSDPKRIGVVDNNVELLLEGGGYSRGWQWVDLPKIVDQYVPSTPEDVILSTPVFGWEKIILEFSGLSDGDIEVWERHSSSYEGVEWTEWERVGYVLSNRPIFYLTHIKTMGDRYDGIQFRVKMRSGTGESPGYKLSNVTLVPIVESSWYSYRYFEPQFPVVVSLLGEKRYSFDLPVISEDDTPRFVFRIQQDNGEFVDLTDASIFFKAKEKYLEEEYIFDKIVDVTDAEYGLCEVRLSSDDTRFAGQYIAELSCSYGDSGKLVLRTYLFTIRKKI